MLGGRVVRRFVFTVASIVSVFVGVLPIEARGGQGEVVTLSVPQPSPKAKNGAPVVFLKVGAVYTSKGNVITGGKVAIRDGLIVGVGADLDVPKGATVIEIPHGSITAGLIDAMARVESVDLLPTQSNSEGIANSELRITNEKNIRDTVLSLFAIRHSEFLSETVSGVRAGVSLAEQASEVIPQTRVIDSINFHSPDFDRLLAGGVTTVYVPGDPGTVISSQGTILRTGGPEEKRVVREAVGVKATMGSDSYRLGPRNRPPFGKNVNMYVRRPTTRMGVTWVFRKAFYDTQRFENGSAVSGADAPNERAMAVLKRVLAGEIPLWVQARMQHDILTAIRLCDEFDLKFVLQEATEAYRCIDELKTHSIPVVFGPIYEQASGWRASSGEVDHARLHTLKALIDAGIETALTAQELRDEDGLARQAMYAIRFGVDPEDALEAVTATPAKLLGLADRTGTVTVGKRGDLVVWSGEPFAATSKPVVVLVGGEMVVDKRNSE